MKFLQKWDLTSNHPKLIRSTYLQEKEAKALIPSIDGKFLLLSVDGKTDHIVLSADTLEVIMNEELNAEENWGKLNWYSTSELSTDGKYVHCMYDNIRYVFDLKGKLVRRIEEGNLKGIQQYSSTQVMGHRMKEGEATITQIIALNFIDGTETVIHEIPDSIQKFHASYKEKSLVYEQDGKVRYFTKHLVVLGQA